MGDGSAARKRRERGEFRKLQYTENYQLPQWAEDDRIMMGHYNMARADLDRGLAGVAKASADGLAAVRSDLGSGGKNARIAWGTYKGNGKCGAGNPNRLEFGFKPIIVVVGGQYNMHQGYWPSVLIRGAVNANSDTVADTMTLIWSDTGVSWYAGRADSQDNNNNDIYYYVAVGE